MSEIKTEGSRNQQTLCWDCENATGGCSWSDHNEHTPVEGWTAIETRIKVHNPTQNDQISTSYIVLACPEFIKDARLRKPPEVNRRREIDKEQVIEAYQRGVLIKDIEEATGYTSSTIYDILLEAGVRTGGRTRGRKKRNATAAWAEAAMRKAE